MARGSMPWTEEMMKFLEDGEWHSLDEVVKVGISVVPPDRALEEMGKTNRAQQQGEERRIAAGQWTVAQQALKGRQRFGQVEYAPIRDENGKKLGQKVRKISDSSVSIGNLAERVTRLEGLMAQLADTSALEADLDKISRSDVSEGDE